MKNEYHMWLYFNLFFFVSFSNHIGIKNTISINILELHWNQTYLYLIDRSELTKKVIVFNECFFSIIKLFFYWNLSQLTVRSKFSLIRIISNSLLFIINIKKKITEFKTLKMSNNSNTLRQLNKIFKKETACI